MRPLGLLFLAMRLKPSASLMPSRAKKRTKWTLKDDDDDDNVISDEDFRVVTYGKESNSGAEKRH